MLGSNSPRMLGIGLPVVDSWNVWWSIYDNSVERFAQVKAEVDAVMPEGRHVEATAAVLVTLPGGEGRLMGDHYDADGHDRHARRPRRARARPGGRRRHPPAAGARPDHGRVDRRVGAVLADLDR